MKKDPAILFYTGDFLTGCADLTFEERGQYITLLCLQHQKGHLSEKMIRLAVGKTSSDVMIKFKADGDGNFYNERMEIEIGKRAEHSEIQRKKIQDYWDRKRLSESELDTTVYTTEDTTEVPLGNEDEIINREQLLKEREIQFLREVAQCSEQYPYDMVQSFCRYWTEPNKSKTKMKWELQKTFEISRRLITWASNDKVFNKQQPQPYQAPVKMLPD